MLGRLDEVHTKRKLKIYVEKTKGMMFERLVEGVVPTGRRTAAGSGSGFRVSGHFSEWS